MYIICSDILEVLNIGLLVFLPENDAGFNKWLRLWREERGYAYRGEVREGREGREGGEGGGRKGRGEEREEREEREGGERSCLKPLW